jgi:uncharacterized protein
MLRLSEVKLPLEHTEADIQSAILKKLSIAPKDLIRHSIFKRSYDARKKGAVSFVYIIDIETTREQQLLQRFKKDPHIVPTPDTSYRYVTEAPSGLEQRPIVIGCGPCGMFAGLLLAQMGFRPLILERGKAVHDRSVDTFGFWSKGKFNPESNAQFGEGGAGTFSDGKLYSRIKDANHHGRKVLAELVNAGAAPEILYINKPHIGTYRLVKIVENIRNAIASLGGEIRFQSRVEQIKIENGQVCGITLASGEYIPSTHVPLKCSTRREYISNPNHSRSDFGSNILKQSSINVDSDLKPDIRCSVRQIIVSFTIVPMVDRFIAFVCVLAGKLWRRHLRWDVW